MLFYFRFLKKEESHTSLGKNYINPKKNQSLLKEIYLTTYDVPFTNSPCRFLSKLRIMRLTVVLPQKKGSSKRLFSSCQTWMRSLDCPTHVHGVEDVHHDILQVVVEVSD